MLQIELEEDLDLEVTFKQLETYLDWDEVRPNIIYTGWAADFPAPVNFLVHGMSNQLKRLAGWFDESFEGLISDASKELDRKARMVLYRAADRYLVHDQVLVIPIAYIGSVLDLVKPWITNFRRDALQFYRMRDITMDLELKAKMLKDYSS